MEPRLIIYLHTNDLEHSSWIFTEPSRIVHAGHPNELAQYSTCKHITVIVPAIDVLLLTANLPNLPAARLQQALPYALEEQLIDDVENLHFAINTETHLDALSVAVVSHSKMQTWDALLQQWSIQAQQWLPASLALPYGDTQTHSMRDHATWYLKITSDSVILRTTLQEAIAFDLDNISNYLHIAWHHAKEKPHHLEIANYTATPLLIDQLGKDLEGLSMTYHEQSYSKQTFMAHIAETVAHTPFNLLQGQYTKHQSTSERLQRLHRLAFYGVIALISSILLSPLISYAILKHHIAHFDQRIQHQEAYRFLSGAPPNKLRQHTQSELNNKFIELSEKKQNQVLLLLAKIGKAFNAVPMIQLERINYEHQRYLIDMSAKNSNTINLFMEALTKQNLSVVQQHVALTSPNVRATLLIEDV